MNTSPAHLPAIFFTGFSSQKWAHARVYDAISPIHLTHLLDVVDIGIAPNIPGNGLGFEADNLKPFRQAGFTV